MSYNSESDVIPYYPVDEATAAANAKDSADAAATAALAAKSNLYIDPAKASGSPSWAQGQLARNQWDDFLNRYKPLEDDIFSRLNANPQAEVDAAGSQALAQSDSSQEQQQRAIERRGLNVTAEQAAAMSSQNKRQDALAVVGAKNSATRAIADRNLNAATSMISIGKEIAGGASTDLSSSASLQAQRDAQNTQSAAADRSQRAQIAGTAVGLAAATSATWLPLLMAL